MNQPTSVGVPVAPGTRYVSRELSWLDFNARVLQLAEDPELPLLERVRFLAIFSSNLDEFFQVRVAALKERAQAGVRTKGPDGLDAAAHLRVIRERVEDLVARQTAVFSKELIPALRAEAIHFVAFADLDDDDRNRVNHIFETQVFPVLTPLAVDPAHPFPYISNLSLNLAVVVRDPQTSEQRFARVKVPPLLPRYVELDDDRFIGIEAVIAEHLDRLFPGMEVVTCHPFRVTRNADVSLDDDAEDLMQAMQEVLQQRTKFGVEVRLEVDTNMDAEVLELLERELELNAGEVYIIDGPLDLAGVMVLTDVNRPDLLHPLRASCTPTAFAAEDVFGALRSRDALVHHPYESFAKTVEAFIGAAARDPNVQAIKQTLYRTGGDEAGIAAALAAAARAGKQVTVVIELKARFDELTNIERAQLLEEAGVHVVYGLVGLKTHAKATLVVRQEHDGLRRYCHIGTGNYNPNTARTYEDLGLFSADRELCSEVAELFNHLTGYSRPHGFRRLLIAPSDLRAALSARIRAQSHPGGRIVMKMNSLVDAEMIDALCEAGQAGCEIDLIVRGVCCLVPGVPGLSDQVRVRSLIGRYLEHSRIFCFGNDPETAEYLIGSADLMPRNLDRRVEALVDITDPEARRRIAEIIAVNLEDDVLTWELQPDGTWRKEQPERFVEAHLRLHDLAAARSVA